MLKTLSDFLARPFSADMSALQWGLFLGFILMMMIVWTSVFSLITMKLSE